LVTGVQRCTVTVFTCRVVLRSKACASVIFYLTIQSDFAADSAVSGGKAARQAHRPAAGRRPPPGRSWQTGLRPGICLRLRSSRRRRSFNGSLEASPQDLDRKEATALKARFNQLRIHVRQEQGRVGWRANTLGVFLAWNLQQCASERTIYRRQRRYEEVSEDPRTMFVSFVIFC
jgi:hypothetical protein